PALGFRRLDLSGGSGRGIPELPDPPGGVPADRGAEDDRREWDLQEIDTREGGGRDDGESRGAQRPAADAQQGGDDQRDDRGLQAGEDPGHGGHASVGRVDARKPPENEDGRNDEEGARDDSAPGPVEEPADVDRELLRLRTRQQHAEGERVEEPLLGDPAAAIHQIALHDRDLSRRPAEAHEAELDPVTERLPEADSLDQRPSIVKSSNWITESALVHRPTRPASLKVSSVASSTFVPSNQTTKWLPAASSLSVCHAFLATRIGLF